jgi:hypothetical protein
MADDQEVLPPERDMLNKLSVALIQVSRGDPLVALRNEIATRLQSIDTRFSAIDKAIDLAHEDAVRVPTQVDKAINAVRDLLEQMIETRIAEIRGELHQQVAETGQKFIGVAAQFAERDTRTDQRAGDTKLAVDAAFAAAKEATAKIEAGFTKQIDAQTGTIDTKTGNLDRLIGDLKDRVTAVESRTAGIRDQAQTTQGSNQNTIAIGACVIAAITVVVSILLFVFSHAPSIAPVVAR